jgi:biopolymer transport protein ExbD
MPRIKIARKSTAIDMTAMCDVAFLLLTFFILTATARKPEALPVDSPSSTTLFKQPDTNLGIITVGHDKVFYGVAGQFVREDLLKRIGERYSINFTPQEIKEFSTIESFGVPVDNLKQFLSMDAKSRAAVVQPGIPMDTIKNELFYWVMESRYSTKAVNDEDMRVSIKGDSKEEYPLFKKVIAILQNQNIDRFSLITKLKEVPKK